MYFEVASEGRDPLNIAQLCQRHADELWVPAHLTDEQAAEFVLDHFRRSVLAAIEMLEVKRID